MSLTPTITLYTRRGRDMNYYQYLTFTRSKKLFNPAGGYNFPSIYCSKTPYNRNYDLSISFSGCKFMQKLRSENKHYDLARRFLQKGIDLGINIITFALFCGDDGGSVAIDGSAEDIVALRNCLYELILPYLKSDIAHMPYFQEKYCISPDTTDFDIALDTTTKQPTYNAFMK